MDKSFLSWLGCKYCLEEQCKKEKCRTYQKINELCMNNAALFDFSEMIISYDLHKHPVILEDVYYRESVYICEEKYLDKIFNKNIRVAKEVQTFWDNLYDISVFDLNDLLEGNKSYIIIFPIIK